MCYFVWFGDVQMIKRVSLAVNCIMNRPIIIVIIIKKLVIIPIVEQQQSALELHDFLLQTMTMTTSQNDDETTNSVMEIICLQDVEEQAFQQARQLLTSLQIATSDHDNDDEDKSTPQKILTQEMSTFIPSILSLVPSQEKNVE